MALVIEDGTGKADAQSYASEAELAAYALERGITVSGTDTELLIQAMDYIETKNFIGDKNTKEQALQWPRIGAITDGFYIDTDEIPLSLIDSQIEVALSIDGGINPMSSETRETKKERVGDIEVEYMDGARPSTYLTAAETKLKKLIRSRKGSIRV